MEGQLLYDRLFTSSRRRKIRLVATNAAMGILGHEQRRWGGSVPGHRVIHRDREGAWNELKRRYFDENPLFDAATFRRRFRMEPSLWDKICREVCAAKRYFMFKPDAVGKMGFHGCHKCVVAMRMLAYGTIADALDDGYAMAESTVLECVREFATTIIQLYESEYLRAPTQSELSRILAENEARGFPGMIGSIDCMHWEWRGCPVSHHGQYQNRKGKPTMILEAVATKDLRVWHAFFGMPGSHNDINVLHRSPVFDALAKGETPPVEFTINGNKYNMPYYLADKIYPDWATLVKTKSHPVNDKDENFAEAQESARKDVERFFGVLRSKFRITQNPGRFWDPRDMNTIMRACIILHNMIVEHERDRHTDLREFENPNDPPISASRQVPEIDDLMKAYSKIKDTGTSHALQHDLVEHHWTLKGNREGPYARRQ